MCIPVLSHPDIGPPRSKRRAAHGWDVCASPQQASRSRSIAHPGLFQGRYAWQPSTRRRPPAAARQGASAGLQCASPSRPRRPLTPPGTGSGSPLTRRREPWLRVRHAARQHRPSRRPGPSTPQPHVHGWHSDTDRMFVTSRQSGISTAHVDSGAPHVYSRPRKTLQKSKKALRVTTNLKQMMYLRRAR